MRWYPFAVIMGQDHEPGDPRKISPRKPISPLPIKEDALLRRYRKALRKQAARSTKRMIKNTRADHLEQVVWGRLAQDAYLDAGWHPISEEVDPQGFTKMTMRLDIDR